ncbi:hypothetical protein E2C01_080435 [Portunus trituberculatus]|uniref:Uncharacterized protein n=1 Tax=Portunus trituberculatus TaxID=210409 RepID=A0A5B7ITG1_PORTR|nr:hypothetical protein [Portunus trituberculatus]
MEVTRLMAGVFTILIHMIRKLDKIVLILSRMNTKKPHRTEGVKFPGFFFYSCESVY